MKYIMRKILTIALPIAIVTSLFCGIVNNFEGGEFSIFIFSIFLWVMLKVGKTIRRIKYTPINILRKVLFKR